MATVAAGLLIIAIVSSHQLTPLIMVLALAALVALQRLSPRLLLFAVAMVALWLSTVAMPFMSVMLPEEMQRLGTAVANVRTNLADISAMSPGQAMIARVARLLTTAIVLAAVAGGVRRLLGGVRDGPAVALAAAPLPLLVATSYGGEAIFRVYLFALPFLAFLAAALFYPSPARGASSRSTRIAAGLFGAALAVAFVFANNGKDRRYAFTRGEIAAARWLYETAPPNTLLIEGASIYAAPPRNYENFVYVRLAEEPPGSQAEILSDPAGVLASWLEDDAYRDGYVILTRTQKAYVDSQGVMRRGALDDIERALRASPRFRVVHEEGGSSIFALRRARGDTSR
ncbi:MAG: hypothetical protein IRY94_09150 [Rhodospirillaceae bacterium]|nr:hypothetical protein [Rhodospirillaceae bacterium]